MDEGCKLDWVRIPRRAPTAPAEIPAYRDEPVPDTLSKEQRRRCMQSIRSENTQPEIIARRYLHRLGFRFRLHASDLTGKPDIVLRRFRTVIFVHGCFWHSHTCSRAVVPKSRPHYWMPKLARTRARDLEAKTALRNQGWKVITLWECQTKKPAVLARRCRSLFRARNMLVQ